MDPEFLKKGVQMCKGGGEVFAGDLNFLKYPMKLK